MRRSLKRCRHPAWGAGLDIPYPLSREHAHVDDLKQKLALHRLAFGQLRQEDLLMSLQSRTTATPGGGFVPVFIDLSPGAQTEIR